ncbi:MAG: CBS domain-containing protein [Planctomycetota bacterium]|jgi:CBS domain-containing protein
MFEAEMVMATNVIAVNRDLPIYEAIRILVDNNVTGLPVVNDDMTLAGIITEKDVLRLLYDNEDKPGKVEDFMTETVISFDYHDSLIDIAECFMKHHIRRVPILEDGKLVGVVSRRDIIECILKHRHKETAKT